MYDQYLDPILIAVFPRWTEAGTLVCDMLHSGVGDLFAIALAESAEQAAEFRQNWPDDSDQPLLLLRCPPQESVTAGVDAVAEIATRKKDRPVGVLVADGPEVKGFREERRWMWNKEFSSAVCKSVLDVQVFEFAPTWATRPPRVR